MKILHSLHGNVQTKEGEAGFLLTAKNGDYLLLFPADVSMYQGYGVFLPNSFDYVKIIDAIHLDRPIAKVKNRGYEVDCEYGEAVVSYALDEAGVLFDIENYHGGIVVDLDVRHIHESDDQGRMYTVSRDGEFVVVEFTKFCDAALSAITYRMFTVFLWRGEFEILDHWKRKWYPYDASRGARGESYVYEALRFLVEGGGKIIAAAAPNLTQAKVKALHVEKHWRLEKEKGKIHSREKKEDIALVCAEHSCRSLTIRPQRGLFGIFAGLPWFFQFWTRDELISSVYLLTMKEFKAMKDILLKYAHSFGEDGRLPNRLPHADLGSADGTGWFGKRLLDLVGELKRRDSLEKFFSLQELQDLYRTLFSAERAIRRICEKDGLIYNRPKETWMDTDFGGDMRDGARIEIQALHLALLQCVIVIGKQVGEDTKDLETEETLLRERVRSVFFDGKMLADGYKDGVDWTVRPNVFIAHYCYPDLLSKKEWKSVFSSALERLWLPWGGLSTIAKDHHLFCDTYTGMDNRSYHRGDSWFFLNSMAAICMHDVDKFFFKEYISKIREAASEEILFSGVIGHHAEVSSAKELSSKGCFAQGWSAALFCELCNRVRQ
jgi:hypothetical protein